MGQFIGGNRPISRVSTEKHSGVDKFLYLLYDRPLLVFGSPEAEELPSDFFPLVFTANTRGGISV